MRWGDASIVRRLVILSLLAGLVPGLVGILLVRGLEERSLSREAIERNDAVALQTAAAIDGRVGAVEEQLRLVASIPGVAGISGSAADDLSIALRVSDELDQLVLHDVQGRAVAAVASSRVLDPDEIAVRPPELPFGAGILTPPSGLPVVEVAVPVEDPPGTVVGTLTGQVPLTMLTPEVDGGILAARREAILTDDDGVIVAHRETDRVLARQAYPAASLRTGVREVGGPAARRWLISSAELTALPATVIVEQPEAVALAPAEATMNGVTAVLLAVVAGIVAAVILTGRRLLRPLRGLVEAVARLERGDRAVRVPTGAAAEVGALAEGFNRMAGALDERRSQLEAAEISARRSEERLRLLVEGVEDYAIVLLGREGRIRSWNTGAHRLLGYDRDEALGRPFADVFAAGGASGATADPLLEAATSHRGDTEGWCQRGDGTRFWARTVATALTDEQGDPYGYAVVVHDLTERQAARVALEDALAREQEAAEELRRTSELKDEFLAIATHEIRTPLAAILGASNLLSGGAGDLEEEEQERMRSMIATHAQDLRQMVDRLLDFTRLQAGRAQLVRERFDLAEELERVVNVLERQLADHALDVDVPSRELELDREGLRHVVTNLLSNAAKFSPPGSTITLAAAVDDEHLVVRVSDQGRGIPAADHETVFELFRQSTAPYSSARGTGVGLAIVKRYVELAGGDVTLESAEGEGATFTVTLPLTDPAETAPVGGERAAG
ncbi:MAG: PAS domain S-box protein [Actinobacteria bacterium]|nr:PAS domain S-box protein [Actinomycetota bacterium]